MKGQSASSFPIRLAQAADIASILEIANWYAAHTPANFAVIPETLGQWSGEFATHGAMYPWLIAERRGATGGPLIAGFAKAGPFRTRCAYAWTAEVTVYLTPPHQGSGLGTSLYGVLLPILRAQGYQTAVAGITLPNEASVRLHERFGFAYSGTLRRAGFKFGRWHDVGFWDMSLQQAGNGPVVQPEPVRRVQEVVNEAFASHAGLMI